MAAGSTYTPIATQTLGSAAASVTFSSISGSYTDLVLVINATATAGNPDVTVQLNSDSATNYSRTALRGSGTAASSNAGSATGVYLDSIAGPNTTNAAWNCIANFMNYSNTTTYKTVLVRENNASLGTAAIVNLWRSTSAITTMLIATTSSTFTAGSTFSLYGILAA